VIRQQHRQSELQMRHDRVDQRAKVIKWESDALECWMNIQIQLSVAYSPNGNRIASCSKDCTVRIWDAGQEIAKSWWVIANG